MVCPATADGTGLSDPAGLLPALTLAEAMPAVVAAFNAGPVELVAVVDAGSLGELEVTAEDALSTAIGDDVGSPLITSLLASTGSV